MLAGLLLLGGSAAVALAQSPDASSTPTPTSDGGSQDQPDSTQDVERDCPLKEGAEAS